MAKSTQKKKKLEKTGASQRRAAGWSRDWIWGAVLGAAVMAAYAPVWRAGFIWDDAGVLTQNPVVVGPLGLKEIWTTSAADICPLTLTTFWLEHALWGLAPLPYRLVNVLLHAGCAVTLWRVLKSLRVPGAWLGAALWALHPVQAESVAWISEMKNTESGLFFLLSILFFVKRLRDPGVAGQTSARWYYALTLMFAALAMAAKSSTVILPVVLGLCAWWIEGRWSWRHLVTLAPVFLMSVIAGTISLWTQETRIASAVDSRWLRGWPEWLATAGDAVWFYLGKLIWPHPLMLIYPRWKIDPRDGASYLSLAAVLAMLLFLWRKRGTWSRPWFFAFAYFVVALLPVLGFANLYFYRYSLVADHFQYLADIGPLALSAAGLAWISRRFMSARRGLQSVGVFGLLLLLGAASWNRSRAFVSDEKIWTDTVAKNPGCWVGYNNLGNIFSDQGRLDEAMAEYQKALTINPENADEHNNLGTALLNEDRLDAARLEYRRALEIDPHFAEASYNLGVIFSRKGQMESAITQYRDALKSDPDYANAHNALGIALAKTGHGDEAIAEFKQALRLQPGSRTFQQNLAKAQADARKSAK